MEGVQFINLSDLFFIPLSFELFLSLITILKAIQHYVIKFVSDIRQVGGFLRLCLPIKLTATA